MLKNNHGHIVALSSCAGLFGLENLVPYCGTKFAVHGMMEALSEELRMDPKCKIETTCVFPYMVDTGLCKRPKVKFEKLMPLLKPRFAAKAIMRAQQMNKKLVSIPGYLIPLNNYVRLYLNTFLMNLINVNLICRLMPIRTALYVKDFINSGVESDL